jgi:hypothetical protein
MLNRKHLFRFLLCLFCLIGSSSPLRAQEASQEYQLKAAFIVNFSRFITWPEQAFSPQQQELNICVAGKNPFGSALIAVEHKIVNGHAINIVYAETLRKPQQCHLLYISSSEKTDLQSLFSHLDHQPVVTISDIPGFVDAGGSIEFVIKEDRLSFIINNSELRQRGIQAGASMLDLAASVR